MLDLAAVGRGQGVPYYRVVDAKKVHRRVISQRLSQRRRAYDIRKQNSSDSGISCIGFATRNYGCPGGIHFPTPKKTFRDLGLYLNNLLGNHAVGFTVNVVRCLCIWCVNETESLTATLVNPILEITNTVLLLHFEIGRVRFCDVFRSHPVNLVNVHVCWHNNYPENTTTRLL
jgi:hypothetical protein